MTVGELRAAMTRLEYTYGVAEVADLEVILRATNHETDDVIVCGITSIGIESGCTEVDALMIDGSTEMEPPPEDLEMGGES